LVLLMLYFTQTGKSINFANSHNPTPFYTADAALTCG